MKWNITLIVIAIALYTSKNVKDVQPVKQASQTPTQCESPYQYNTALDMCVYKIEAPVNDMIVDHPILGHTV